MEIPGLAQLVQHAPGSARKLEDFVRRLIGGLDADRWAADQVRALVEAHARGDLLSALVGLVRAEAGTGEVWAVLWSVGVDERMSFSALAGQGEAPPEREGLSRTLLDTVGRRGRAVWLDEDAGATLQGAPSLSERPPHGAVPLGRHGAVYLGSTPDLREIGLRQRLRIEALCRIAGGFVDAAPDHTPYPPAIPGMVGSSRVMQELARAILGFASVPWPVLVLGETGTGKELVARALHDRSPRSAGPFVAVNCAAIPDELAESTLFGHERGAFTGADRRREGLVERANGGTLFLDEVGELSPRVQAKLLRLLQEGRYERVGGEREVRFDGRIVAATLRPMGPAETGFRADLFHRLGACVVGVPPLRDRREDVRPLARHLLGRALAEIPGAPRVALSDAALDALEAREWPGNVRQLDNVLKSALARSVARGVRVLLPEHLEEREPEPTLLVPPAAPADRFRLVGPLGAIDLAQELGPAVDQVQRALVDAALAANDGNRPRAAAFLGVSRQWLHTLLSRRG